MFIRVKSLKQTSCNLNVVASIRGTPADQWTGENIGRRFIHKQAGHLKSLYEKQFDSGADNLGELAAQLLCLLLRQAGQRSRIGRVPHGSAYRDVGEAVRWLAGHASVRGVQVDVCWRRR